MFFRLPLLGLIILLLLPMSTHVVSAQSPACIPIFGQKWPNSYIGVYVAGGVSDIQRQQVLLALNIWYSSQQWFIDSFEGGVGTPYLFYLTDGPGEGVITVSFLIGQGLSFAGRALNFAYTVPGNAYVKGEIQINLPPDRASNPTDLMVESIILHEFGHGLGLGHSDIQSDAMYAIDNYPQSYGLPSTLDLYAVYMLKQSADPSALGGSVCLPSQIGYGIPPWVQQNPSNTVIVYPGGKFTGGFTYSFTASPIVVGQTGTLQLTLNGAGDYPIRIVALNAQTDSGQTLAQSESLPRELEPGNQHQFTFQLQGSNTGSVGTHSITLELGFQVLTTEGWSSQTNYRTFSANYEVTSAPLPQPIQTHSAETTNQGSPSSPAPLVVGAIIVIIFLFLAFLAYSATKKTKPRPQRLSKAYCFHCGAENPVSFDFCGKCGEKLRQSNI